MTSYRALLLPVHWGRRIGCYKKLSISWRKETARSKLSSEAGWLTVKNDKSVAVALCHEDDKKIRVAVNEVLCG